jgi:excisionase family DNA binding protein
MESRKRSSNNENSGIKQKLDKLADDIKKLPPERQDRLKDLMVKRAYSTENAAKQLGISLSTLRRFIKSGAIKYFRLGKRMRISADEIEKFGNVVNLKEAADILGVHPLTVNRLIKSGRLKAYRIGRPYRIAISDLEQFMQSENPSDTSKGHKE